MRIIKRILFFLKSRMFLFDSVILFEMKLLNQVHSPVVIKKANYNNLKDILNFQKESYIPVFEKFLDRGDIGYFGYIDDLCIHRSWAIVNEGIEYSLHPLVKKKLEYNEVYIHYCETASIARGKNVYPHVISEIAKEFRDKKILICVNEKNIASIKGVTKAGFVPVKEITIKAIFGLVVKKEKDLKGEKIDV